MEEGEIPCDDSSYCTDSHLLRSACRLLLLRYAPSAVMVLPCRLLKRGPTRLKTGEVSRAALTVFPPRLVHVRTRTNEVDDGKKD